MYKEFKKKYPHVKLKQPEFCKILHTFFKKVQEKMIAGVMFNFRNQIGFLQVIKVKRQLTKLTLEGKPKMLVDFGATKIKKRDCTEAEIANGEHVVYRTNLTFNRVWWHKWTMNPDNYLSEKKRNVDNYMFKPAKDFKLLLPSCTTAKLS